jgi:hypothetical protein
MAFLGVFFGSPDHQITRDHPIFSSTTASETAHHSIPPAFLESRWKTLRRAAGCDCATV